AVTVNKAISIQGHGFAGIAATGSAGITIDAGASDAVNVTGVLIEGSGIGQHGIYFTGGRSLTVESCIIRGAHQYGIIFQPAASNASFSLAVSNTYLLNNSSGLFVAPVGTSVTVNAEISRVEAYNHTGGAIGFYGIYGTGTIDAVVTDSAASGNLTGFSAV